MERVYNEWTTVRYQDKRVWSTCGRGIDVFMMCWDRTWTLGYVQCGEYDS